MNYSLFLVLRPSGRQAGASRTRSGGGRRKRQSKAVTPGFCGVLELAGKVANEADAMAADTRLTL